MVTIKRSDLERKRHQQEALVAFVHFTREVKSTKLSDAILCQFNFCHKTTSDTIEYFLKQIRLGNRTREGRFKAFEAKVFLTKQNLNTNSLR